MTRDNTQVKKLREENGVLKSQLTELQNELNEGKKKLETHANNGELQDSVNFISADYDDRIEKNSALENDVKRIDEKLAVFTQKIDELDEAIEAITAYSYQYNIKILGIPQANDKETAEQTVQIA